MLASGPPRNLIHPVLMLSCRTQPNQQTLYNTMQTARQHKTKQTQCKGQAIKKTRTKPHILLDQWRHRYKLRVAHYRLCRGPCSRPHHLLPDLCDTARSRPLRSLIKDWRQASTSTGISWRERVRLWSRRRGCDGILEGVGKMGANGKAGLEKRGFALFNVFILVQWFANIAGPRASIKLANITDRRSVHS